MADILSISSSAVGVYESVLRGRQAAGLPLNKPAVPHVLAPEKASSGLPLAGPKAYPLNTGPQGLRLKARDLIE